MPASGSTRSWPPSVLPAVLPRESGRSDQQWGERPNDLAYMSTVDRLSMNLSLKLRRRQATGTQMPECGPGQAVYVSPCKRTRGLLIRGFGVRSPGGPQAF
jgi:hypothetical protein